MVLPFVSPSLPLRLLDLCGSLITKLALSHALVTCQTTEDALAGHELIFSVTLCDRCQGAPHLLNGKPMLKVTWSFPQHAVAS